MCRFPFLDRSVILPNRIHQSIPSYQLSEASFPSVQAESVSSPAASTASTAFAAFAVQASAMVAFPDGEPSDSSLHRKSASNHKAQASSADKTEAWPSAVLALQVALVPVVQAAFAPAASVAKQVAQVLVVSV